MEKPSCQLTEKKAGEICLLQKTLKFNNNNRERGEKKRKKKMSKEKKIEDLNVIQQNCTKLSPHAIDALTSTVYIYQDSKLLAPVACFAELI